MSTAPNSTSRSSVQGMRLLGRAIALAAMTGLLAYGCEKSQSPKPSTPHAADGQPKPGATEPIKEPAKEPTKEPTKEAAKEPAAKSVKPVEIGSGMVQGEKPAPVAEPDPKAPPKPKPIAHDDLPQDVKPLSEFTAPTMVVVQEIKAGKGMPTLPKAVVTIHFVFHVKDGWKKIQSTYDDGEPEVDQLDEIVGGLADGIVGMQPGATRRIIIPPERGFGAKGITDKDGTVIVPPGATLVFDVDLVSNKQTIVETAPHKPVAPKFDGTHKNDSGK